jgi:hypothetical protein
LLRRGGSVFVLVDRKPGVYSENIFRFAGRVGARVLYCFSELQRDGTIVARFVSPPDPYCKSAESIRENVSALDANIKIILSGAVVAASLPA